MFDDLKNIVTGLLTAVTGLFLWIGKREIHRIDKVNARVDQLDEKMDKFLTKDEFTNTISVWRDERREMHEENRNTLRRIHERVDSLWERGQ